MEFGSKPSLFPELLSENLNNEKFQSSSGFLTQKQIIYIQKMIQMNQ
ncbi:unnamed protein product [Paramecium sonneborni]|uniref:Uncharacterized protein n=1 Tax=Paramecium sonneborni TaxID=65129 RepID=A0A8S1RAY2_9CILI|nr:unnamed protein product [Paramecium sonneborni]